MASGKVSIFMIICKHKLNEKVKTVIRRSVQGVKAPWSEHIVD